jgi:hypothetical protein
MVLGAAVALRPLALKLKEAFEILHIGNALSAPSGPKCSLQRDASSRWGAFT